MCYRPTPKIIMDVVNYVHCAKIIMDVVNYISDWDKEPYANTSDNWPGWDAKFKDNPKYKGIINDINYNYGK